MFSIIVHILHTLFAKLLQYEQYTPASTPPLCLISIELFMQPGAQPSIHELDIDALPCEAPFKPTLTKDLSIPGIRSAHSVL